MNDLEYILEMDNISKEFPGVKALDGANLKVRPHSVHALMGENGAGKSTLMKCLFGIYEKDSGKILFEGKEINFTSAKEALVMEYQWFIKNSIKYFKEMYLIIYGLEDILQKGFFIERKNV